VCLYPAPCACGPLACAYHTPFRSGNRLFVSPYHGRRYTGLGPGIYRRLPGYSRVLRLHRRSGASCRGGCHQNIFRRTARHVSPNFPASCFRRSSLSCRRRRWQRHGLGTALVSAVMNELADLGEQTLGSAYNVANTPSIAWHRKLGFEEVPDLFLARARGAVARHELKRRERIGGLTEQEQRALEAEVTHWDRLGSRLAAAQFG
jgi:GNAT superfamily N-acetyltransferase